MGKFWKAHSFSIESYQYFIKLYDEMRYYKRVSNYYIYDYMLVPVKQLLKPTEIFTKKRKKITLTLLRIVSLPVECSLAAEAYIVLRLTDVVIPICQNTAVHCAAVLS